MKRPVGTAAASGKGEGPRESACRPGLERSLEAMLKIASIRAREGLRSTAVAGFTGEDLEQNLNCEVRRK